MARRVTLYRVIVTLTLCLTLGDIPSCVAYEDCNAIYMQGEDVDNPGKCTTFQECPVLFDILKSPHKTSTEVKLLQKLTCKPDNDNPLICCAIEDIVSETNNNDYAIKGSSSKNNVGPPNDGIVFESAFKRPPSNNKYSMSSEKPSPESLVDRIGAVHPNFNLLPPLTECSVRVESSDRIIGGNRSSILSYPWLARIGYYSVDDDAVKYLCAGTVINKRYVLTAAHCTQELNLDEYTPVHIRLGESDETCSEFYGCSTPIEIKIDSIIPHPDYSKRDKANDVLLIRLAEDIPFDTMFIKPVCLPFVEEYGLTGIVDPTLAKYADSGNETAFVAGWGKTRWTNQDGSKYLMDVRLPIVSQQQCQRSYRNITRISITEKQICAGGVRGRDSCGGDSGGGLFVQESVPIFAKIKRGKMFQFGIVSFGPTHCAVGKLQGVYSLVYSYKKWILDQLKA